MPSPLPHANIIPSKVSNEFYDLFSILAITASKDSLLNSPKQLAGSQGCFVSIPLLPNFPGKEGTEWKIFITQTDLFGMDRAMYTFTERCHQIPGMELGDETMKIFLNMSSKNERDELVSLLQYMKDSTLSNPEILVIDNRIHRLDAIVTEVKQSEEWEDAHMSILSTGIEIGRTEGIQNLIRMGQNLHLDDSVIIEQLCSLFNLDLNSAKELFQNFSKGSPRVSTK